MRTIAVYAGVIAAGTVLVLLALYLVRGISDFPRKAMLTAAIGAVAYGVLISPENLLWFLHFGITLLALGLPVRWSIYPVSIAAIGPLLLNVLQLISFEQALGMFALGGPIAAVIGSAYWSQRKAEAQATDASN